MDLLLLVERKQDVALVDSRRSCLTPYAIMRRGFLDEDDELFQLWINCEVNKASMRTLRPGVTSRDQLS